MPTYQPKVYRKQGGDEMVVGSGGVVTVESGGAVTIASGGTITIASGGDIAADQIFDGADLKNTADANVIGGIPVLHRILVASGANGDTNVTLTHKTRIVDAWAVLKGAGTAGCLITVKNGATAITDAMDVSAGGDRDVFRCGEIDDAQQEISAAGTLRVSKASTGADFPGAEVYVLGLRVA